MKAGWRIRGRKGVGRMAARFNGLPLALAGFQRVIPVPEYLQPTRVRFLEVVGVGRAAVTSCCHELVAERSQPDDGVTFFR